MLISIILSTKTQTIETKNYKISDQQHLFECFYKENSTKLTYALGDFAVSAKTSHQF